MLMDLKNGKVGESWVWGGSLLGLMLAAVTRQAVLGVMPMAMIMPIWQRQKIQMIQTQYHQQQSRLQRQFDSLQRDYLASPANGQRQPSQDDPADLKGLKNQIKDLQNNLGRIYTQVGNINNNQGSLNTHVQQLDTKLSHTQTQVAQVIDNQGSLNTQVQQLHNALGRPQAQVATVQVNQGSLDNLCSQIQRIQSQWDHLRVAMQLDTSAMGHLTAVRQQLSLVMNDVRILKLSQAQDPALHQEMDQLRQDLNQVVQALAKQPQRKPLGVFIDGANITYSARQRGISLDYPSLVEQLVGRDPQPDVFFYSGYDPTKLSHQQLKRDLEAAGLRVIMQKVTYRTDGSSKANMDPYMMVDMLRGNYDRVVLLSGDGDFVPVLKELRERGIRIDVAAFSQDTHGTLKTFPFVDLTKLLQPGGQVVILPQKQVPPQRQA